MIQLTRINHSSFVLNSDLIESIQSTPDTVITLTNGRNYMVLESPDDIIHRILQFRRACSGERLPVLGSPSVAGEAAEDLHVG
jgi:flagellar protein FlbD